MHVKLCVVSKSNIYKDTNLTVMITELSPQRVAFSRKESEKTDYHHPCRILFPDRCHLLQESFAFFHCHCDHTEPATSIWNNKHINYQMRDKNAKSTCDREKIAQ